MADKGNILVIGAAGQIGIELVLELRNRYGEANVIASDIRIPEHPALRNGPFVQLDVMDRKACEHALKENNISTVYHLAAMLSARAEKKPGLAWDLNMVSLLNLLELAREGVYDKLFWPSSIAVFGPNTPRDSTPQHTICEPTTVYGISKLAGERWCQYYFDNYGVDVRSLRYPGLIGHRSKPGGGTTDYAVDIFHAAIEEGEYICFLEEDTELPMMYMEDAIRATIDITEAPSESVKIRSSYNLAGITFSPATLAEEIQKHLPNFLIHYNPDERQAIADSWPNSIDDAPALEDWKWDPRVDLSDMTVIMLDELRKKKDKGVTHQSERAYMGF